ncbi:MAG: DUF4145 domain-containing protein [Proteobacteria bacterium]|nr:DUF4145 domain-containing protein [Pseudomonadota bacterium]
MDSIDEDGNPHLDYEVDFIPKYFSKPLELFRPPTKCPGTVKEQIRKSFSVFHCDLGAAANHIRQCVEEILSHAGIESRNTKGRFLGLERRIKLFANVDHENAERADALRWIGNFGSHPEALTKKDLFDAYEILEVLLEDIYVGQQRFVRQIVQQINKDKRPRR